MSEKIKIFHNYGQYANWNMRNCLKCNKALPVLCDLFGALLANELEVSNEDAERIGYAKDRYVWECPEKEEASDE